MSVAANQVEGEVRALLGSRFTTSIGICTEHGQDESRHPNQPPDAVCFPETAEEICHILKICNQKNYPVIPYGAGSNVEGQICAVNGGLCVDTSRMAEITRVSQEDMDCTVQAGVTRKQLNSHLRDSGLFFPVDPGADASLGGDGRDKCFRDDDSSLWGDASQYIVITGGTGFG